MRGLVLCLGPMVAMAQQGAPDPQLLLRQSTDVLSKHRAYRRQSITKTEITGGLAMKSEVLVNTALRRPNRLRIESGPAGARMTMVSDGSHSWIYLEPSGEYIERSAGASPQALLQAGGFTKPLPEFEKALRSVTVSGEETLAVAERLFPCWILEKRYGVIDAQGMTLREATETLWIAKSERVTLKNVVHANVTIPNGGGGAEINQTTLTLAFELDGKLPDSMFTFTPPKGAKQIADWSLPGISRPDVVGKPAPPLLAEAIGGGKLDLTSLRGNVVVLDFWATWCGPCRVQLPILDKLQKELGGQGLRVVGISVGEETNDVATFLKKAGITFANTALGEEDAFVRQFGISGFPTTVVMDREGVVVSYEVGQQKEASLRAQMVRLLGGQPVIKSYTFRGKVEAIDRVTGNLTVAGDKVDGWMEAMTMVYATDDPVAIAKIRAGDQITATVYDGDLVLHGIRVTKTR